jgi:hypothetical protein
MNLQSLKESILADAFERRAVTEFCLAERLIHERAWAAAEIERLTAENERLWDVLGWIDTFDPETTAAVEQKFGLGLLRRVTQQQAEQEE